MLPYFYRWNPSLTKLKSKDNTFQSRPIHLESLERRELMAANVMTDLPDYAPSETAHIFASGYQLGEAVQFQVLHSDGIPNTGNGHDPWAITDGSLADLDGQVDGNIHTTWFVDPDDSANSAFDLTAVGLTSGTFASTTFTDAGPSANLDHLANLDTPDGDWTDGNLGSNKAFYREGDSVANRIVFENLTAGMSYSITISYDTAQGGKHTYDYLTTWNRTVDGDNLADPNDNPEPENPANPLEGVAGAFAPPSTFAIPTDSNVAKGQNGVDDAPPDPQVVTTLIRFPASLPFTAATSPV